MEDREETHIVIMNMVSKNVNFLIQSEKEKKTRGKTQYDDGINVKKYP